MGSFRHSGAILSRDSGSSVLSAPRKSYVPGASSEALFVQMLDAHMSAKKFVDSRRHLNFAPGIQAMMTSMATALVNLESGTSSITTTMAADARKALLRRAAAMQVVYDEIQPLAKGGQHGAPWHSGWTEEAQSDTEIKAYLAQTLDTCPQIALGAKAEALCKDTWLSPLP
jgi:hypothetical protein